MITAEGEIIKGFSRNDACLVQGSLNDASGYPYEDGWNKSTPPKVNFLFDKKRYLYTLRKLDKFKFIDFQLERADLAVVINALELLYYENGDFEAIYSSIKKEYNVTKEDLKILIDKLKKLE